MAMVMSFIRPDRVTATGVVAPYPVRQQNPVSIARETVNPFISGIRRMGHAAAPLSGCCGLGAPYPSQSNQVVSQVRLPAMPSKAASFGRKALRAATYGNIWSVIKANRFQIKR